MVQHSYPDPCNAELACCHAPGVPGSDWVSATGQKVTLVDELAIQHRLDIGQPAQTRCNMPSANVKDASRKRLQKVAAVALTQAGVPK